MILAGSNQSKRIHALLKSSPDDFVVNEIPLYEPCGDGEHLYLTVRKRNMSHDELIRKVAKEFGVPSRNVGCAGRKDLKATTSQVISVHLPGQQVEVPSTIGTIDVISSNWHSNKLRLGHLSGNRFSIVLREVDEIYHQLINERMKHLSKIGLPNAFGPQRFGNTLNNHVLGKLIVREEWDGLVEALLRGDERHNEFVRKGELQRAFDAWPFGQPSERNVLEALLKGKTSKQACNSISYSLRKLWVNAFQSYCFNRVLFKRVEDNTWNTVIEGDVIWKHDGGGKTFIISPEEVHASDIRDRVNALVISPTGPLWGSKMRIPSGEVQKLELAELESCGVSEGHLVNVKSAVKGARRPLRVRVGNVSTEMGFDSVKLHFELPAGSYATVVANYVLTGET